MNATLLDTQVNTKDIKSLLKNIKDIKENSDGDFFENILKTILSAIEDNKTKNFLLEKFLNSSKDLENFEKLDKMLSTFSKGELKLESDKESSQIGEVLVEDLLKLSFMIKNDIDVKDFKTDSKELKMCCQNKEIVAEFKDAKNIKDLLQIAKKHDIKVKNFEFFKEELALNPIDQKSIKTIKTVDVFNLIENKLKNSKENLIKNLKEDKTTVHTLKTLLSSIDGKEKSVVSKKEIVFDRVEKKQKIEIKETKKSPKEIKQVDNKKNISERLEVTTKQSEIKSLKQQTNKALQNAIQTIEKLPMEKTHKKVKKVETNEIKNSAKKVEKDIEVKEQYAEDTKVQQMGKKLKTIKITKSQINPKQKISAQNQPKEDIEVKVDEVEISSSENKIETAQQTKKTQPTRQTHLTHNVKRTLNTFAQDFKEQVESYKPPLMRVKMQLNPKGLGDVDVTMINRGNNLHITVTSNHNTISIFSQNQVDFKNSLVNMGFSELSMNFNENSKNKDEQNSKNKNQNSKDFEDFSEEESFEMTTPLLYV